MENKQLIESLEYHIQEFAKRGRPWDNHFKMTPEQKKEYQKQYYQKNREKLLQRSNDYYKNKTANSLKKKKKVYTPDDWDADFHKPITRKDAPDVYDAWDEYNQ